MFVRIPTLRFKLADVFFLGAIAVWLVLKAQQSQMSATLILLRYYFGFYIFYLFFNNYRYRIDLEKLLFAICIAVIIEAVLVNTIVSPMYLPNYPKSSVGGVMNFETRFLGFYQRPYSIGNNASITSTLIMVLVFTIDALKRSSGEKLTARQMILATVAVIMLASGVGLMIYFLFWVFKIRPFKDVRRATFSILTILLIYLLIFGADIGAQTGFEKISAIYINFLIDFKTMQVEDVYTQLKDVNGMFIGMEFFSPNELVVWGDFAWNDLFYCTGYLGLFITIGLLMIKINRLNKVPLLIFMLATFHYSAMYALPGQMLLGYFFSTKFKLLATDYERKARLKPELA
ncbi:hypothetical protein [uncultured Chitinophaga sp.]|uniref:hypothetical protein n=1 Tax=uncultured Chitinophaga sp. TaxID=339340 RepID=UPI0025EC62B8|nr:hypothetical protein [uncultured Chitinophaga sp.]